MSKCNKKPKHIPYGSERKKHWCDCDMHLTNKVNKTAERMKVKKETKLELFCEESKKFVNSKEYKKAYKIAYEWYEKQLREEGRKGIYIDDMSELICEIAFALQEPK